MIMHRLFRDYRCRKRALNAATTLILGFIAILALPIDPGHARNKTNRVQAKYVVPKAPEHQELYTTLKQLRLLERLSQFLSPLRLPRRLTLKLAGCDGSANAFYEDGTVTVCYEYIDFVVKIRPPKSMTDLIAHPMFDRKVAVVGPTVDVFLHEVSHAIFDMLKIPVLGREEDAADLVSAYFMLQFDKSDAYKLILGVVALGAQEAIEARKEHPTERTFADEHGLPAQRYFNVLCMAYGADPKTFAEAITIGRLPVDRAKGCADEYKQVKYAIDRLLRPHISKKLLRMVRKRSWLNFDESKEINSRASQ
jgi:Putative metallopeptidase